MKNFCVDSIENFWHTFDVYGIQQPSLFTFATSLFMKHHSQAPIQMITKNKKVEFSLELKDVAQKSCGIVRNFC